MYALVSGKMHARWAHPNLSYGLQNLVTYCTKVNILEDLSIKILIMIYTNVTIEIVGM